MKKVGLQAVAKKKNIVLMNAGNIGGWIKDISWA